MILTVLSSTAIWAIALVVGYLWNAEAAAKLGEPPQQTAWWLLVFPPLATWLVIELVHAFTPRRVYDRRSPARRTRVIVGVVAGFIGLGLTVATLPLIEQSAPDWAVISVASAIGAIIPTLLLTRLRRGTCAICGYDLRNLPRLDRCPECGRTDIL